MANPDPFFLDNSLEPGLHGQQPTETPAEETPAETPVEEKIKLGEKEYTQAELQKLVGLGEIGLEAESKYKTRLDRVWPEYTKRSQELVDLRNKNSQYETQIKELTEKLPKEQPQNQLSQEQRNQIQQMTPEMKSQALKQLQELNRELGYVSQEDARRIAMETIQGQNLINDITGVIDEYTADGLPNTTVEDVLSHMQESGIRNPEKAYRDMFETEYLQRQAEKIAELKAERKGLPTTTPKSTAGAKTPAPVKVTDDNLDQLVAEAFRGAFE